MVVNLHQRFNHYLNTEKKLDLRDVNERIIAYGWTDDGNNQLTGYYILTENHVLYYDLDDRFVSINKRKGGREVDGSSLEN